MNKVERERLTRLDESSKIPMQERKSEAGEEVSEDQINSRGGLRI